MSDLVTFLRARLDEDEQLARLAADDARGMGLSYDEPVRWRNGDGNLYLDGGYGSGIAVGGYGCQIGDEVVDHIARHDPARVRQEVDAKRAIIDLHVDRAECTRCERFDDELYPCDTLKFLASVYTDHQDYRKEWTP